MSKIKNSEQKRVVLNQKPPEINVIGNSIAEALSHDNLFSPDECKKILALAGGDFRQAYVTETLNSDISVLNEEVRNNSNYLLIPGEDNYWVFDKLLAIITAANAEFYQFEINQFQGVQISKYEVGEYYHDHFDIGPGVIGNRKLSLTLQLSKPDSYEGGDLILDFTDFHASRELGSVTIFPSFIKHGIRPVTKGTRYSLVAWVSGKNRFK